METLLIIRESIITFFKRYEPFIMRGLRFLLGLYVFSLIHGIGLGRAEWEAHYGFLPLTLLLALAFALLPLSVSYLFMIASIVLQHAAHIELAAVIFLFLLLVWLFYARLAPKESVLILLTVLAFRLGIPYAVPLVAGLFFPLTAIIPVVIGVFIARYTEVIQSIAAMTQASSGEIVVAEVPAAFMDVYTALLSGWSATQDWIFIAFIYAMVMILVHVVSRLAIDYAKEIAIGLGCAALVFGHMMAVFVGEVEIHLAGMIFMVVLCGLLAGLARVFAPLLDYQRAEFLQFSDENNVYNVRIIPKIQLSKPQRMVRRIRRDEDERPAEAPRPDARPMLKPPARPSAPRRPERDGTQP